MSKLPRRILVADPDDAFARALCRELEARGCAVEMVSDGLSAINVVKTRSFSGAVVDSDLMTVGGVHVLGLIKELKRALPVVVTSKRDCADIERQVREAGGEAYVAKPCAPASVADALQQCMSGGASAAHERPSLSLARLEPGQVLLIECPGGQVAGRMSSRLVAKHPASLVVAAPRRDGEALFLPFGVPVAVGFPMPDGWYYFDSHVLGAVSHGGEPALLLAQPKLVSHIQRRQHVRARSAFGVELSVGPGQAVAGKWQDACEGGMRVLTEQPLPVGGRLPLQVEAGADGQVIGVSGTVVWTQKLRDDGERYRTGIKFAPGSEAERRRLHAWVEGLHAERRP
jgi:ActR/RegA family two-component response regulator